MAAEKIKLNWKKIEIARVVHGTLAIGTTVRIDGKECDIGDYLVKTSDGIEAVPASDIEGLEWLDTSTEDIPELEVEK